MKNYEAVVIGASAGAVEALSAILPKLKANYPIPIIVVVHLPPDRKSVMTELFRDKCLMKVKEAEDKEYLEDGTIYFAPPDYHVLIESDKSISLSNEEPVLFSRPSIDVLFETAADCYGAGLLAVVLSGANSDGANGLKAVIGSGGAALVQDPASAHALAMPEAALKACPSAKKLSLNEIVQFLEKGE